jgi:hypothetical protein
MERYVRIVNKDKESETIKSMECFPASSIKQVLIDSKEDENRECFYYIKITDAVGTICVYATRGEDECYYVFYDFYDWLKNDESKEFIFTIDKKEINDYFEKVAYF